MIITASTSIFQENRNPTAPRSPGFSAISGMPAKSVPEGQTSLQNHGVPPAAPVINAGMLGAKGVQVGTRFLSAYECGVAQAYKDAILAAKDTSTTATGRSTGHPVRCLRNKLTRKVLKLEATGGSEDEINELCTGTLAAAVRDGDVQNGSVMSGQVAGLVRKEQPAAEIIRELFSEGARIYEDRADICLKSNRQ